MRTFSVEFLSLLLNKSLVQSLNLCFNLSLSHTHTATVLTGDSVAPVCCVWALWSMQGNRQAGAQYGRRPLLLISHPIHHHHLPLPPSLPPSPLPPILLFWQGALASTLTSLSPLPLPPPPASPSPYTMTLLCYTCYPVFIYSSPFSVKIDLDRGTPAVSSLGPYLYLCQR